MRRSLVALATVLLVGGLGPTVPTSATPAACPAITVGPSSEPDGTVGQAYHGTLNASGGTAPYSFAVTGGSLPPGLTLNPAGPDTATIDGTPSTAGSFGFGITATDMNGCTGSNTYQVTIHPQSGATADLSLRMTASATSVTVGDSVTFTSIVSNGGPDSDPSVALTDTLPDGTTEVSAPGTCTVEELTVTCSIGALDGGASTQVDIGGTLTMPGPNTNSGQVSGTDTDPNTGNNIASASVTVGCPPIGIKPHDLAGATVDRPYSETLTASGGTPPYRFAVTEGALPAGLKLNGVGELTGSPTDKGTFTFTVTATDAVGCTGSRRYTITVELVPAGAFAKLTHMDNLLEGAIAKANTDTLTRSDLAALERTMAAAKEDVLREDFPKVFNTGFVKWFHKLEVIDERLAKARTESDREAVLEAIHAAEAVKKRLERELEDVKGEEKVPKGAFERLEKMDKLLEKAREQRIKGEIAEYRSTVDEVIDLKHVLIDVDFGTQSVFEHSFRFWYDLLFGLDDDIRQGESHFSNALDWLERAKTLKKRIEHALMEANK